MAKQINAFIVLALLGVPTSVLAQHDHGASRPDAGTTARPSDLGIEQIDQIHQLTARLAVINETLRGSEDPHELQQGVEEQGRILAELKSLVAEHHALMVDLQENPKPEKSKKKGCGRKSAGMSH